MHTKKFYLSIGNICLALLFAGCAATTNKQSFPGDTLASLQLQYDVKKLLDLHDSVLSPQDCYRREITNTEALKLPNNDGKSHTEIWTLDRCSVQIRYRVIFRLSPKGGTTIQVSLEK